MTVPLTRRDPFLGARRDLKSPEEEAGVGVETVAETDGGKETGDTVDTRLQVVSPVRVILIFILIIMLIILSLYYHCRLQL